MECKHKNVENKYPIAKCLDCGNWVDLRFGKPRELL